MTSPWPGQLGHDSGMPNPATTKEALADMESSLSSQLERLGWTSAPTHYCPFLSHSELEAFFGSPSGLYELLASVLGLRTSL